MFETNRQSEIEAGRLLSDNTALWPFVTIPLFQEWFVITRSHLREGQRVSDTVLVQGAKSFLEAIEALRPEYTIEATQLVTPGRMNGSQDWQMSRLKELWELETSSGLDQYLFVLVDGTRLPLREAQKKRKGKLVYQSDC